MGDLWWQPSVVEPLLSWEYVHGNQGGCMIPETDRAYIAGLFDGEGSIYYKKVKEKKKFSPSGKVVKTKKTARKGDTIIKTKTKGDDTKRRVRKSCSSCRLFRAWRINGQRCA